MVCIYCESLTAPWCLWSIALNEAVAEFRAAVPVCFPAGLLGRAYSQVELPERVWPRALPPAWVAFQDALPGLVDSPVVLLEQAYPQVELPERVWSPVLRPELIVSPDGWVLRA